MGKSNKKQKQYEKIYDNLVDKIYRYVFLKVGQTETAQDIVSQVFIKGWKKFKTGEKIENESAYIFRVAKTTLADHYRKSSKYKIVSASALVDLPSDSPTAEQEQEIKLQINQAQGCLGTLKDDYQDVLILRYIDGYDINEIALMLNKTEANVRVLLSRAMRALREQMARGIKPARVVTQSFTGG